MMILDIGLLFGPPCDCMDIFLFIVTVCYASVIWAIAALLQNESMLWQV